MLVFERRAGDERLLCAFNLGAAPVAWDLGEGWRIIAQCGAYGHGQLGGYGGLVAGRA